MQNTAFADPERDSWVGEQHGGCVQGAACEGIQVGEDGVRLGEGGLWIEDGGLMLV